MSAASRLPTSDQLTAGARFTMSSPPTPRTPFHYISSGNQLSGPLTPIPGDVSSGPVGAPPHYCFYFQ